LNRDVDQELDTLRREGLLRELRALPEAGGKIAVGGAQVLNFSSNDYLDLARHPALKAAAIEAVQRLGCGAAASRLMSGHLDLHEELESDLARFMETQAALVFGSGFLTNLGVLTALAGPADAVFADRLNHASLIDGMRLSGAKWHRYHHKDPAHLESLLKKSAGAGRRIIVSDSVFSMDGDVAPLKDLEALARRYEALLVVDEAHAIGVMGARGNGVCRCTVRSAGFSLSIENGLKTVDGLKPALQTVDGLKPALQTLIVGTLSKALGGYGGFVACGGAVKQLLVNRARSFIYSTALPPACLGAGRKAVEIVSGSPELGAELLARARRFHDLLADAGFSLPPFESQILPIRIGDNQRSVDFSKKLRRRGLIATAVRPPTVPQGTARLRLSVTLAHTDADLEWAARILAETAHEEGIL
jgi:7-keto-8-aminopelargonate synthetase-like enzyme